MSITATQVKELRQRTGAGLMDCKRALGESGGDMEAALDFLRKKGLATAEKRAGRAATEGLIAIEQGDGVAAMVEVNCETDFVSRNEEFQTFAEALPKVVLAERPRDLDALLALTTDSGATVSDRLTELIGKIGEKMQVTRFEVLDLDGPGVIDAYIHLGGRVGVLVMLGAETAEVASKPEFKQIAHELALQIAFSAPLCLDRDGVPADLLEREQRISRERALEEGKPENIVEKIVEGQVNKYLKEVVLLDQAHIREEKMSVRKWLEAQGKSIGAKAEIKAFACFRRGEASQAADEGEES